uniref:energy transducer TonB n=1 Tax=Eikenella corrodens TaxID=539 RepID=UPI00129B64EF
MLRKILFPSLAALLLVACAAKPSFEPAMLVHSVQPVYPQQMEEIGVNGSARVQMRVNTQGNVSNVRVLSASHPLFGHAAARAVSQYRFTPAKQNGQPVESAFTQTFRFRVPEEKPDHSETAQPPHPP